MEASSLVGEEVWRWVASLDQVHTAHDHANKAVLVRPLLLRERPYRSGVRALPPDGGTSPQTKQPGHSPAEHRLAIRFGQPVTVHPDEVQVLLIGP